MIVSSFSQWPACQGAFHEVLRRAVSVLETVSPDARRLRVDLVPGKLFYMHQSPEPIAFRDAVPESHTDFIDIQCVLDGVERIGVAVGEDPRNVQVEEHPERDVTFWKVTGEEVKLDLRPGDFVILFPGEIHRPCCRVPGAGTVRLRKAVFKIHRSLLEG